jgi:ABC-type multidrug transport system fused ATPase/permease subunit
MHQGEVSQMGTHEELLARGGLYAELHDAGFSS